MGKPLSPDTPRAKAKAATREKLIVAAREAFHHHGYDSVTIRDLAKAVGMSTGAMFSNFADKASLYEAAMDEKAPDVIAFLDEVISARGADTQAAVMNELVSIIQKAIALRRRLLGHHA